MATIRNEANSVYEDGPVGGAKEPEKSEIRALFGTVEDVINGHSAGYDVDYELRSQLFADLDWEADSIARVFGDPTTAFIGVYKKSGASGAGSWAKIGDLPGADVTDLQDQVDDIEVFINTLTTINIKGADIAATGTINLATATGELVDVTGEATVTALGTVTAGTEFTLRFTGICTITHNATSLILPGGFDIVTKTGDVLVFRSLGSGSWVLVSGAPAALLNPEEDVALFGTDIAGNRMFPDGGVEYDPVNRRIETEDFHIEFSGDDSDDVAIVDVAGNRRVIYSPPVDNGFTPAEYAYVEARAIAKRDELNAVDVSGLATYTTGANLFYWLGQSFAAGDNVARLWASASYISLMGWQFNGWSISPEYRTMGTGSTYTYYPGGSGFFPLVENFITPSAIVSAGDVAEGNYTSSERGGTPGPLCAYVFAELRRRWLALTVDDATRYQVHMSSAKGGGTMTEIGTSPELDRALDGIAKFKTAVQAQTGSTEPGLSGGESLNMAAKFLVQGQASDSSESDWPTLVNDYDEDIDTAVAAQWTQTGQPPMFLFQTGGRNYGSTLMYASSQAVEMMLDVNPASANFNKTIASDMWDGLSPGRLTNNNPDAGNWHPFMSYSGKLGIMAAAAAFYMLVRGEYWWMPFPYEVFEKGGKKALLSIPCKFGKLRTGLVADGHIMRMLDNKGISFEDADGNYNTVLSAEIVEGYDYLVEVECERAIGGTPTFKLGDRNGEEDDLHCGLNNFRDSFKLPMALEFPFSANQTISFGSVTENVTNNDLGYFVQDVPEWVGPDVDLGCRAMRHILTTQAMPAV
ncbi:hypothetical protein OIU34_27965 [Pararhizobium sp. BT-229]|uniref:hypothetical protein n=1 Tax=Pararhizobium sp. BT-229 TaxID=2986923 RepID=UPI0021F7DA2B|nr:hypothetical protein [Pararhizobium sp. BT-229]MCV9965711.1 hypothetical protein [Pararhizobium sp. BT-229]